MENLNSNYIESYINLQALLSQQVNSQCNNDFISFVRLLAPSLVSGFKMLVASVYCCNSFQLILKLLYFKLLKESQDQKSK